MRKTKIVATIGPASKSPAMLKKMILAGVNVARLNFSHGTLEEKRETLHLVRETAAKLGKSIAVLCDLPGPKIRLGVFDGDYRIKKGEALTLGVKDATLPILYDFSDSVKTGQRIYINDGLVELEVVSVKEGTITVKAKNSGVVSSRKGINLPDTILSGNAFTKEDREAAQFAIDQQTDFIALSFVQSRKEIDELRSLISKNKSDAKIIAKIEKPEAVKNIEEIIEAADGVMIARGDLAIETSAPEVPLIQQRIIVLARQYQKPVIVATQMLESMIENPRPTRAEASDVANAVLSQVDAVMLSAESASGSYPVEAVATMCSIIEKVEEDPQFSRYIKINWEKLNLDDIHINAIVSSSASLSYRLKSPVIGVGTVTGKTAMQLSAFRPNAVIAAMTHKEVIARQLCLSWGVYPVVVETDKGKSFGTTMLERIKKEKLIGRGQTAVLVWGEEIGIAGTTNTIKAVKV